MLDPSARLLRLLSLLQARSFWTGPELADRLLVTERTVRRDVDRLRSLGYPVNSSSGVAGGYQLGAGASLPPLLFENDEALSVTLGLRMAAAGTVAGLEESTLRALAKIEQVLPSRIRRDVEALHASVVSLYSRGPAVQPELLMLLARACRNRETLAFHYNDARGRKSQREVEPHGVVHTGTRWYLAAWDLGREAFRTLRVDRIEPGDVSTGRPFQRRPLPEGDVAAYVARSITTDAYAVRAKVLLRAPAEELRGRIPPSVGKLEPRGQSACLLTTGAHSLHALALHIAFMGVDFEVHEPPELLDVLKALSDRMARARRASRRGKRSGRKAPSASSDSSNSPRAAAPARAQPCPPRRNLRRRSASEARRNE